MSIYLDTRNNQTRYRPGDVVAGIAGWEFDAPPESVEVCLFWHTSGKGDRDIGFADRFRLTDPKATDAQPYRLQLPDGPYSFSGRLITLTWSIELIVDPGQHVQRLDLSVSPTGEAVALGSADDRAQKAWVRFQ